MSVVTKSLHFLHIKNSDVTSLETNVSQVRKDEAGVGGELLAAILPQLLLFKGNLLMGSVAGCNQYFSSLKGGDLKHLSRC